MAFLLKVEDKATFKFHGTQGGMRSIKEKLWYSVVFSFCCTIGAFAQSIPGSPAFIHYSIEHGLPSAEVYDILQDKKGYIWVATDKGVSRFDGTTFKTFTTRDGLTDNTVLRIIEDDKGRVWFMTYNRRLCFIYKGKIYSYKHNDILREACSKFYVGHIITRFFIDAKDNVTLVMTSGTVITLSHTGDVKLHGVESEEFTSLIYWNDFEKSRIEKLLPNVDESEIMNPGATYSLTRGRLRFFSDKDEWLICSPFGVTGLSPDSDTIQNILGDQFVTGFCADSEGGKWFCTLGDGLYYLPNPLITTYAMFTKRRSNYNASFFFQDSTLMTFFSRDKIFSYKPKKGTFESYEKKIDYFRIPQALRKNGLKFEWTLEVDIIPDEEKGLLNNRETVGLYAFQEIFDSIVLISLSSSVMLKGKLGDGYINNYESLKYYPKIFKIHTTTDSVVLLGSIWGLYRFDVKTNALSPVNHNNELFQSRIQDIVETSNGLIVLATRGRGVLIWDRKTDAIIPVNTKNGLLSNSINHMLYEASDSTLWVATSTGVNYIRKNKHGSYSVSSILDRTDGLNSLDIRQIALYDDYLFAGTSTAIIRVPRKDTSKYDDRPVFFLKDVTVSGTPFKDQKQLKLTHDQNDVRIAYQGISFNSRGKLRYFYQMEGVDDVWHETKETTINYGSMSPGIYNFKVKAVNAHGVESVSENICIEIAPPFWKTWWFRMFFVISGAIGLFLVVRSIINRYKYQANMERRLNELRSLSLRVRMNPHFIFNSLNSVQNYILKNQKEEANDFLVVFSKLIRLVLQNSDALETPLKKELEMISLYIKLEKKRLRKNFVYTEKIDPGIDINHCLIPSLLIQPFIENAIWHSNIHLREDGEISLTIELIDEQLRVEIRDNGIGRKSSEKSRPKNHSSFATSITKKRISLLAEGDVSSAIKISDAYPGNEYVGTSVLFVIPYKITP